MTLRELGPQFCKPSSLYYDVKIKKMPGIGKTHKEGEAETQVIRRYPQQANPPGVDRDLRAD